MPFVPVTRSISIHTDEIIESATRASGAGGQHVNTTDSAVILRFDVARSPNLPDAVKTRLAKLAGSRMTLEGVLVLRAEGSRSQHLNREDARARLLDLIREATVVPKSRRPTRPGKAAKARRLDSKAKRGAVKSLRGRPVD